MPLKDKYNEDKPNRCDAHAEGEEQPLSGKMQQATTTKSANERGQDMGAELETFDEASTLKKPTVQTDCTETLEVLKTLADDNDCSFWIASDFTQQTEQWFLGTFPQLFSLINAHRKVLSTNFRNSREISDILNVVRENYLKHSGINNLVAGIVHEVDSGHFIRGTKPKIVIFRSLNKLYLNYNIQDDLDVKILIKNELSKVADFEASEVGIIYRFEHHINNLLIAALNEIDIWQPEDVEGMRVDMHAASLSSEWPVVIALLSISFSSEYEEDEWLYLINLLYLTLSRATVHSCVFIQVRGNTNQDVDLEFKELVSQIHSVSPGTVTFVTDDLNYIEPMS